MWLPNNTIFKVSNQIFEPPNIWAINTLPLPLKVVTDNFYMISKYTQNCDYDILILAGLKGLTVFIDHNLDFF